MPLNGKTHHHLLKTFAKKIEPDIRKYRECVKHSGCAIRKFSSMEIMGQINFNKYIAGGREDGNKCRLKRDSPKRHMKQCVNLY